MQQADARRWAESQALYINSRLKEGTEPFTAADFLGEGNRQEREIERHRGAMKAAELRKKLSVMKPGQKPAGLPKWATG